MSGFELAQAFGRGGVEQSPIYATAPAAGSSFSLALQRYDRWRLVACNFTLATDAHAANRYVTVEYSGRTQVSMMADAASVVWTANTSAQRFLGSVNRGVAEWNTNTDVLFPLSGLWLEAGSTVSINVANIQVGDTLTNIVLVFDRTLVRDDGSERGSEREWPI